MQFFCLLYFHWNQKLSNSNHRANLSRASKTLQNLLILLYLARWSSQIKSYLQYKISQQQITPKMLMSTHQLKSPLRFCLKQVESMRPIPVLKALLIIELFVFMKTREKVTKLEKNSQNSKKLKKNRRKNSLSLTTTELFHINSEPCSKFLSV